MTSIKPSATSGVNCYPECWYKLMSQTEHIYTSSREEIDEERDWQQMVVFWTLKLVLMYYE